MKKLFILILAISSLADQGVGQIGTGGGFTLEQSVIASGGGAASGGNFQITGTAGQSIAGTHSAGPANGLHGGFWNGPPPSPTAAVVSVSGRVTTANGRGIKNARLTLFDSSGLSHSVLSGSFGYYSFAGIDAGQTVIVNVVTKRYEFLEPSRIVNLTASIGGLDFTSIQ
ncbi:MAG: carboxypeptidase regulatory-like domain-containing protein [Saprospiraceae bacterium]|nr:carboxypeptidase regulatory-like domain-containing protein [Pyrinomonadaceae bacterium]